MDWNAELFGKAESPKGGAAPKGGYSFDDALKAEGVTGRLADVARSIYQQESSGGRNTKTSNAGAIGHMQIIPATFNRFADKGWNANNPEHNIRTGLRYLKFLEPLAGGKPELIGAGYYGGEGAIPLAAQGKALRDPRNPNAPDTLQYGREVASRLPKESATAPAEAPDWNKELFTDSPESPAPKATTQRPKPAPKAPSLIENAVTRYISNLTGGMVSPNTIQEASTGKPARIADLSRNALVGGVASVPDSVLNTPNNILNLAKMAGGAGYMYLGGEPSKAPQPTPNPDFVRRGAEAVGLINTDVVPEGAGERTLDVLLRGGAAGALGGGGGMNTVVGAGLGATSAGAAAGTEAVTGSPTAGMIAGLVAPAAVRGVASGSEAAARSLMRSSMKPNQRDVRTGAAERAITTALDEGISVSPRGVEKSNALIRAQNDEISRLIQNSTGRVDVGNAADPIRGTYRRFANQVDPRTDLNAIDDVLRGYMQNPVLQGAQTIPVQTAQQLKQGTYQVLRGKYGEQGSAATEAQKALARGLKDEIVSAVPGVAAPNARESALINAQSIIERRLATEGNKNPLGLTPMAGSGATRIAFLMDRSAAIKSTLARMLHSGPGSIPVTSQAQRASLVALQQELAAIETEKAKIASEISKAKPNAIRDLLVSN